VRTIPTTSRARGTGERFSRARFARPGLISISISVGRVPRTTVVRTTARSAPDRTNAASVGTRWLLNVAL
jgi:hypothetical protein